MVGKVAAPYDSMMEGFDPAAARAEVEAFMKAKPNANEIPAFLHKELGIKS